LFDFVSEQVDDTDTTNINKDKGLVVENDIEASKDGEAVSAE